MKKLLITITITTIVLLGGAQLVSAENGASGTVGAPTPQSKGQLTTNQIFKPGQITPKVSNSEDQQAIKDNIQYVYNLPTDFNTSATEVIKKILYLGAIICTIGFIAAGIFYIVSLDNEDNLNKAKNILIYILVGIAVISVSYAIVIGIAKIQI